MGTTIPVTVISGFLGAGKTTFIQKILSENCRTEKIFILENDYGEVGIDGDLLSNGEIQVKEIYSGCICCSLKGEFTEGLQQIISTSKPEQIIIEPTGIGKLSEILSILKQACFQETITIEQVITIVDAHTGLEFLLEFGEFFKDQVRFAQTLVISKSQEVLHQKVEALIKELRKYNAAAKLVSSSWDQLKMDQILGGNGSHNKNLRRISPLRHRSRSDHKAFESFSWEGSKIFPISTLKSILNRIDTGDYGQILRAKGIVPSEKEWLHFDYVRGQWKVHDSKPQPTGRVVVIGRNLSSRELLQLFEQNGI